MKLRSVGYLALCFVSFITGLSSAGLVNITVDDTDPDPLTGNVFTYLPSGRWNQGNDCSMCTAKPSSSLAHNGTWHDTTYKANTSSYNEVTKAAFDFNGEY